MDWFQIGKGVHQGCILSPCLFNLCAEYIMQNAGQVEAQAGIKNPRRNNNNLIYTDDTTLMAESKEHLDESERREWKSWHKLIMASGSISSWQIDGETMETEKLYFLGLQKSLWTVAAAMKWKDTCFLGEKPSQHIKKHKHYLADKGPYSQSYGFSSSHLQMRELDHKEGWMSKNWCFRTVVLEDSWESLGQLGNQTSQL